MNTKDIGDIAETAIILASLKRGWSVSKPVGENQRYDLVIDDGISLRKVQCKNAKIKKNVIKCGLSRMTRVNGSPVKVGYNNGEIDAFAIYCPEINECYLINFSDTNSQKHFNMRLSNSSAKNQHGIRSAQEFKL